jgi:hypothetical protein
MARKRAKDQFGTLFHHYRNSEMGLSKKKLAQGSGDMADEENFWSDVPRQATEGSLLIGIDELEGLSVIAERIKPDRLMLWRNGQTDRLQGAIVLDIALISYNDEK